MPRKPNATVQRLRVAFLIPALDVGGAERMVVRLASGLDAERYDPTVAAFTRGTALLEPLLRRTSVRFTALAGSRTPRIALLYRLLEWVARERPHVLLTYMFHANQAGRLARFLRLVPAVVCGERVVGWESESRIRINRLTARWADVITTNSVAGAVFWSERLGIPKHEIRVIYNGVDVAEFSPALREAEQPRIGVLARLHKANGHEWLIDALARLDETFGSSWTCVFGGTGPEEATLRARVAERRLAGRVEFAGHCHDVPTFLRSMQVVVHPCLVAGMPNAVLEAMACGLPVIATAVGGTPEVIDDGRTGFLVQPGDAAGAAQRIAHLLTRADVRKLIGIAARQRVAGSFTVESAVESTERIIEALAGSRIGLRHTPVAGWLSDFEGSRKLHTDD